MIKAASRTALGEPLLFLGLSGENVTRPQSSAHVSSRPAAITSAGAMCLR
jgi:hypothetical protein